MGVQVAVLYTGAHYFGYMPRSGGMIDIFKIRRTLVYFSLIILLTEVKLLA
jgi:hypothetical protein